MYRLRAAKFVVGLVVAVIFLCGLADAFAQVRVRGYTRKDGTYVRPHNRSNPDGNFSNNWSTKGNVNPYTGRVGTKQYPPANYGDDVSVSGHFRSDGTYVRPHMRSAPDGDFYNNWSTSPNTNPYTGRDGTLLSPPADYGKGSVGPSIGATNSLRVSDESLRQMAAETLKRQGHSVNWRDHSLSQLNDMSARISAAERLERKGKKVNWQDHSLTELIGDLMEMSR